ncbi:MAG: hypothetical protein WA208_00275 [Thermoanaerobaculia bacterium]
MTLDDTFTKLAAFLNSLDAEGEQKFELSHSLVIICPDCGKNIAFRGRCPKCASNSWIPAGHAGGIFERVKAQRLREMITSPDDTATMRGPLAEATPGVPASATAGADEAVAYVESQPFDVSEQDPSTAVASFDVTADDVVAEPGIDATGEGADPDASPAAGAAKRRRRTGGH